MADKTVSIDIKTTSDTSGAKQAQKSFADLEAEILRLSAEVKRLAKALDDANRKPLNDLPKKLDESGKNMGKMGMLANQASYQIGDFFTQVEMGTSTVRAFSQQAPQMLGALSSAGVLSAKMAMTFAGVGAVIPLLAMALPKVAGMFSDVATDANGAGEAIKTMAEKAAKIELTKLDDAKQALTFSLQAARLLTGEFPLLSAASQAASIAVIKDAKTMESAQDLINKMLGKQVDAYEKIERAAKLMAAERKATFDKEVADQKKAAMEAFRAKQEAQDKVDAMLQDRANREAEIARKKGPLLDNRAALARAETANSDRSDGPKLPTTFGSVPSISPLVETKGLKETIAVAEAEIKQIAEGLIEEAKDGGPLDQAQLALQSAAKKAIDEQFAVEKITEQLENTAKTADTSAKLQTVADQGEQVAKETLALLGKITPASESGRRQLETIHGMVDDLTVSQKEGPRLLSELSKLIGQMQLDGGMTDLIKEVVQIQKHQTDNQRAVAKIAKDNAAIEANQKAIEQQLQSLSATRR